MTRPGRPHRPLVLRSLILALLLTAALLGSACRPAWLDILDRTIPSILDVSFPARTEAPAATGVQGNTIALTVPSLASAPPAATAADATMPPAALSNERFDAQVRELLLTGLHNRQNEIVLDEAIPARAVPEGDVQAAISRIYAIYQDIYSNNADFFYLDGAININYTLVKNHGSYLGALSVKPQYWAITANLTASQLDSLISQVTGVADQVAAGVRSRSNQPWQQLQLIHDYLVASIRYDESNDQTRNQAISALLEKTTMCQGYAQSFQLIAQRLGFEVRLINGQYEGVGHAWNLVCLDGAWYHVDVTHDDPTPDGGASQPVQHIHFLRSDAVMQVTHQWTAGSYPACPDDGAQYYRNNSLTAASRAELDKRIGQFLKSINYKTAGTKLLELLYTGPDLPDEAALEKIVQQKLGEAAAGHTVYYRQQVSKLVVLVEITPG